MAEKPLSSIGKIKIVTISQETKRSYLDYAMSVIVSRALPDIRDGLKPVHRRILYAMHRLHLSHHSSYSKSAKVVGEVLGKYHPHGDASVYEAMIRLAQKFSMRYPLVQGQGNFGSIDGDRAAAMRYTEARLAKISQEMLANLDEETIPYNDNFDASLKEPKYLPAILPNILIMGSEGIAVGMATKIPPHNLKEVCQAVIAMVEKGKLETEKKQIHPEKLSLKEQRKFIDQLLKINPDEIKKYLPQFDSDITLNELLEYIKGPDFPTAGAIYGQADIKDTYTDGRGKIILRGKAKIEEMSHGKWRIVIFELPYQVNKAKLVAKIANLVRDEKIKGVTDLRDESDRDGIRVVIELKRNSHPQAILNNLFKKTELETSFHSNIITLVDDVPQSLGLKAILVHFVNHRQEIINRKAIHNLKAAKARAHILEGLKIALDHLDEVISIIKKSKNTDTARRNLMKKFGLTEIQTNAILNMQLKSLSQLERGKIETEYQQIMTEIKQLIDLIIHQKKILIKIKGEMKRLIKEYGDERRTEVFPQRPDELLEEDLIPNQEVIITITREGYIKRMPRNSYRSQRRGGKGVTGMTTKEEDKISQLISAEAKDRIIFFTNKGKAFAARVWEIPEGSRQSKGKAIINLINIDTDEKIRAILVFKKTTEKEKRYLLLATENGRVKKTPLKEYKKIRLNGLIAIDLKENDELLKAKIVNSGDHILLATAQGQSIHFPESEIRATARDTMGVSGIKLGKDDHVIALITHAGQTPKPKDKRRKFYRRLLIVGQNGLGKQTDLKLFSVQHRNGRGLKIARINTKTGPLVSVQLVNHNNKMAIITSKKAKVIKLPLRNIPTLGRNTQGVILMRFKKKDDQIASVTIL